MLLLLKTSSNHEEDNAGCDMAILPLTTTLHATLHQLHDLIRAITRTSLDFRTLTIGSTDVLYLSAGIAEQYFTALPDEESFCLHHDIEHDLTDLAQPMAFHRLETDGTQVWWSVGHKQDAGLTVDTACLDIATLLTLIEQHPEPTIR